MCYFDIKYCKMINKLRKMYFFFQAEDGIRDTSVTGVQTCALPISPGGIRVGVVVIEVDLQGQQITNIAIEERHFKYEIGRASCRERV